MGNTRKISRILVTVILVTLLSCFGTDLWAQCQTCKANVETNLATGGTIGLGINSGIKYLLAAPYVLILSVGVGWYIYRRKKMREEQPSEEF